MLFFNFPIETLTTTQWGLPISVKDPAYGAFGNGIVDDTGAINSAIIAASVAGGIVVLPPGVYAVTATINLASNVYLVGAGPEATTIKLITPLANLLILGVSVNFCGVANLTINENNNIIGANSPLAARACNDIIFDNIEIQHFSSFGIIINGSARFRVTRCKISKDSTSGSQNQAILVAASLAATDGLIADNVLINSGMDICAADTQIVGNIISGFGFGAGITTEQSALCHELIITNNDISGGTGQDSNAFWCAGMETWAKNSIIANNVVHGNSGEGLDIGGQNNIVSGNVVFDNGNGTTGLNGITARYGTATYNSSNSVFVGNQSFNTNGASGSQQYGYAEQNSLLSGIILDGNNFNTNKTAAVHLLNDTVAGLPSASSVGARTIVTDSSVAASTNFGAIVAGGGSNVVPVYADGTNWRIG